MSKHGGSKDSLASSQTSYGIPTPRPGEGEPTHVSTLKLTVRRPQQSSLLSLPAYPSMVAEEEEEEDKAAQEQHEEQPQEEAELGEQLPWHWEQLYKLYGRQANYFLKPRPDENERGRTVGDLVSPKNLRLIGRPGAGSLWRSLRGDSETKLLQQDREISQDLKAAYSAFVRQCLSKCKRPVKRNFSAEEDRGPKVTTMDDLWREQVPEMDRLLDQTRILSVHDYKHMVELMYRASTMNQDRTGILRYNNPPPNLNNWDGDESCGRYMPSWLPDYDEEEVEPEYRKWIKAKPKKEGRSSPSSSSSEQGQDNLPAMTTKMASTTVSLDAASDNQWRFLHEIRPKTRKPKTPKYLFLTEEAATVPGQFSKQRKELLEARHIPAAFTQHPRTNTQSALAMVGENSTRRESDFSEATPSVTHAHTHAQFTSDWQPLSLEALVEYKQAVDALGQGNFNQGTVPRWSTVDIVEKAH